MPQHSRMFRGLLVRFYVVAKRVFTVILASANNKPQRNSLQVQRSSGSLKFDTMIKALRVCFSQTEADLNKNLCVKCVSREHKQRVWISGDRC